MITYIRLNSSQSRESNMMYFKYNTIVNTLGSKRLQIENQSLEKVDGETQPSMLEIRLASCIFIMLSDMLPIVLSTLRLLKAHFCLYILLYYSYKYRLFDAYSYIYIYMYMFNYIRTCIITK